MAEPKLYDDYTLEKMLLEAEQSLAAVQLIEANTISAAPRIARRRADQD